MKKSGFPEWAKSLPWADIEDCATEFGLDPNLVGAVIQIESGGVPYRIRVEPNFGYVNAPERYAKRLGITKDSEILCQKTSWGLMQLMGATARDQGYETHLTGLVEPVVGIYWGCMYLGSRVKKYKTTKAAVAAYNAGSLKIIKEGPKTGEIINQAYIDKVMGCYYELS